MNQVSLSDLQLPPPRGGVEPGTAMVRCALARYQRNFTESLNSIPTTGNMAGSPQQQQQQYSKVEAQAFNHGATWLKRQLYQPVGAVGGSKSAHTSSRHLSNDGKGAGTSTSDTLSGVGAAPLLPNQPTSVKGSPPRNQPPRAQETSDPLGGSKPDVDHNKLTAPRSPTNSSVSSHDGYDHRSSAAVATGEDRKELTPSHRTGSHTSLKVVALAARAVISEAQEDLNTMLRKRTELPANLVYALTVEDEQKRDLYKSMWKARRKQIEEEFHAERKLIDAKLSEHQHQVEVAQKQQFQSLQARREGEAKLHHRAVEWRKRRKETERRRAASPQVL